MTLQDKYSRANSRRYRAAHGGIQSNRAKAKAATINAQQTNEQFPALEKPSNSNLPDVAHPEIDPDDEDRPSYSRRALDSNLERYHEPEPEPDAEPEPEIDISDFLKKQAASVDAPIPFAPHDSDEDIDHAFSHLFLKSQNPRKVHQISSHEASELAQLDDVRKKADANRELRARFTSRDPHSKSEGKRRSTNKPSLIGKPLLKVAGEDGRPTTLVGPLDDEAFLDEVLGDASGTYGNRQKQ